MSRINTDNSILFLNTLINSQYRNVNPKILIIIKLGKLSSVEWDKLSGA